MEEQDELSIYFSDQLLDLLESLGIKSAAPASVDDAFRRAVGKRIEFDDIGPTYAEIVGRIRKGEILK